MLICLAGQVGAGRAAYAGSSATDHFRITAWTAAQGLPQNTVCALLQTRDGYLWAGTRYGLARFDGLRLTAFVDELSAIGAGSANVSDLAEDAQGRLWLNLGDCLASCYRGVFRLVPINVTAAMMTTAMRATIRPYSTAVAPSS